MRNASLFFLVDFSCFSQVGNKEQCYQLRGDLSQFDEQWINN